MQDGKICCPIKEYVTGTIVKTLCKEGVSYSQAERVANGVDINLNHKEYYTVIEPLEEIKEV